MNYTQYVTHNKEIYLVDMTQEKKPFSDLVISTLRKYSESKHITLISQKKSFAHGVICQDCTTIPKCLYCDVAIAYYQDTHGQYFGLCNYCNKTYESPHTCRHCNGHNMNFYGFWAQQIQSLLATSYGIESQVLESKNLNRIHNISQFQRCHNVVIATNMLTQWLPDTDIVIVLDADVWLQLPDFNARWMCIAQRYELICKHPGKQIILQTVYHEDRTMVWTAKGDVNILQHNELQLRKERGYAPYGELAIIQYKHEQEKTLLNKMQKLYQEMEYLRMQWVYQLDIYQTPPMIYKMHGTFRYHIVIKWVHIRPFLDTVFLQLQLKKRGFFIDWMPISWL